MSKKVAAVVLTLCMIFSLAACASSGSSEPSSQVPVSSQAQEPSEPSTVSEPEQSSEPSTVESSEPSEEPESSSDEEPTSSDVNESGLRPAKTAEDTVTEEELQELLTYIGTAVKDEYLTPNSVDPAALVWPSDPNTFRYFDQLITNYGISVLTGESPESVREDYVPASPDKDIMDAVYAGVVNWLNEFESVDYEYVLSVIQEIDHSDYILEYIPANATFE